MTTVTPCRGHGRLYDDAIGVRSPVVRYQARLVASALCARCPIAGTCSNRIPRPSARFTRKVSAMTEPIPTPELTTELKTGPAPQLVPPAAKDPLAIEDVLAWGAAHSSSRVQTLAGRARSALTDLWRAHERETKVTAARARVERLRAQLANAERDLAAAKGVKRKASAGAWEAVNYAAVRTWAAEQGIDVHPHGRPRREVIDAYLAAQQAA